MAMRNSIRINYDACVKRMEELGIPGTELSNKLGRSESWFYGLKTTKTNRNAGNAIADALGLDRRVVIVEETRPEKPVQLVADIPVEKDDEDVARAIRENTATLKEVAKAILLISTQIAEAPTDKIADSVQMVADALGAVNVNDIDAQNVRSAEEILKTMTSATGECSAPKYNSACDARAISKEERLKAIVNAGALFQWRNGGNGQRKCYIVRGC